MGNDLVPENDFRSGVIGTVIALFAGHAQSGKKPGPPFVRSSSIVDVTVVVIGSGAIGMGSFRIMTCPVLSTSRIDDPAIDPPPAAAGWGHYPW